MITSTVRSRSVLTHDRLDAHFFTSAGVAAYERLAVADASGLVESVTRIGGIAKVWDPRRFARAYAAPEEPGKPYLRPYDVFDYVPSESDRLSLLRNDDVDRLVPTAGTLLQTCSGRNLGPVTMADADLAAFALSHDMIRIDVTDADDRFYVFAFLKSPTGQALLRRGKSGSVIDHITTRDVAAMPLPVVAGDVREAVIDGVRNAVTASAGARTRLRRAQQEQERRLRRPAATPPSAKAGRSPRGKFATGSTLPSTSLGSGKRSTKYETSAASAAGT